MRGRLARRWWSQGSSRPTGLAGPGSRCGGPARAAAALALSTATAGHLHTAHSPSHLHAPPLTSLKVRRARGLVCTEVAAQLAHEHYDVKGWGDTMRRGAQSSPFLPVGWLPLSYTTPVTLI